MYYNLLLGRGKLIIGIAGPARVSPFFLRYLRVSRFYHIMHHFQFFVLQYFKMFFMSLLW